MTVLSVTKRPQYLNEVQGLEQRKLEYLESNGKSPRGLRIDTDGKHRLGQAQSQLGAREGPHSEQKSLKSCRLNIPKTSMERMEKRLRLKSRVETEGGDPEQDQGTPSKQLVSTARYTQFVSRNYQGRAYPSSRAKTHFKSPSHSFRVPKDGHDESSNPQGQPKTGSRERSGECNRPPTIKLTSGGSPTIDSSCQILACNNYLLDSRKKPTHPSRKKNKSQIQSPDIIQGHSRKSSMSGVGSTRYQELKKRYSEGKRTESALGTSLDRKNGGAAPKFNMDDSGVSPSPCAHAPQIHKFGIRPALQSNEELIVNLTGLKDGEEKAMAQSTRIPQLATSQAILQKYAKRVCVDLDRGKGYPRNQSLNQEPESRCQSMPFVHRDEQVEGIKEGCGHRGVDCEGPEVSDQKKFRAFFENFKNHHQATCSGDFSAQSEQVKGQLVAGGHGHENNGNQGTQGTLFSSMSETCAIIDEKLAKIQES